jgi:hypothetical protein
MAAIFACAVDKQAYNGGTPVGCQFGAIIVLLFDSVNRRLYQPLSASISLYQPLSASISLYQPLSASISLYQPLSLATVWAAQNNTKR